MTIRTYATPEAFKQALEQRLRTSTKSGFNVSRNRQLLVFDRFLARIIAAFGNAAILNGGLALELRIEGARTTKDIDLRMTGSPEGILARLQGAARRNLGDFLSFEIMPDRHHPEIKNDGIQYEGLRFRTECRLAGKIYGQPSIRSSYAWQPSLVYHIFDADMDYAMRHQMEVSASTSL